MSFDHLLLLVPSVFLRLRCHMLRHFHSPIMLFVGFLCGSHDDTRIRRYFMRSRHVNRAS